MLVNTFFVLSDAVRRCSAPCDALLMIKRLLTLVYHLWLLFRILIITLITPHSAPLRVRLRGIAWQVGVALKAIVSGKDMWLEGVGSGGIVHLVGGEAYYPSSKDSVQQLLRDLELWTPPPPGAAG